MQPENIPINFSNNRKMAKVGDKVRFLNAVGGGTIVRIENNIAYVDDDGFETPVLLKECVVVDGDGFYGKTPKAAPSKEIKPAQNQQPAKKPSFSTNDESLQPTASSEPIVETADGDKLNIVLAYEAIDLKRLSTTAYEAYLVNDSNYFLYFTYMTRSENGDGWITRYAGIVEPNIQVFLCEIDRDMLNQMDRVAIQYIAFKRDKEFALKNPFLLEYRLDTTKFFKLHCFRQNPYFDNPVIAIDIVKNDAPQRPLSIESYKLEAGMTQSKAVDRPHRPVSKKSQQPQVIEVDLHIDELLDSTAGLSNSDMLGVQLKEFRKVMDENLAHKGQKIVFIHGKGEGVLRKAIIDELRHRYKRCEVQDASFREYGFGATQVTIR